MIALSLDMFKVFGKSLRVAGRLELSRHRISESRELVDIAWKIVWICSLDSAERKASSITSKLTK